MRCPFCNITGTRVLDSRVLLDGRQIKRRRKCTACGGRFNTYEVAELVYPMVIKNDKRREIFNEQKLRKGIYQALRKRPYSEEKVESLIRAILESIRVNGGKEITSSTIGNLVINALKNFDQVAYVRFTSVYRCFENVDSFKIEIQQLEKKT